MFSLALRHYFAGDAFDFLWYRSEASSLDFAVLIVLIFDFDDIFLLSSVMCRADYFFHFIFSRRCSRAFDDWLISHYALREDITPLLMFYFVAAVIVSFFDDVASMVALTFWGAVFYFHYWCVSSFLLHRLMLIIIFFLFIWLMCSFVADFWFFFFAFLSLIDFDAHFLHRPSFHFLLLP